MVVKSSVPAGTCERISRRLAARRPDLTVEVAASPDFMREGLSIPDVCRPSRIVLGVQDHGRAEQVMRRVWAPCLDAGVPLTVTTLRTAELCKLAANAYLATRLSFVNTLATDRGAGAGTALFAAVDRINQQQRRRAVDLALRSVSGGPAGHRIGIWGVAFKPGIDDVRDSPALDVAARLAAAGAEVSVYDPAAMDTARREHPELRYAVSPAEAAADARVLMHLTAWPQFAQVDPRELDPARSPVLVDARPGLDLARWREAGWTVSPL